MDKTSIVLKTDKRDRVRTPAHRRDALLNEFERSSLPAVKFSKLIGVRYQTFATWVQKRKQSQAATPKPGGSVSFAEAVLEAQAPHKPSAALRVVLPGGAAMELSHGRQMPLAAALLKALATPC